MTTSVTEEELAAIRDKIERAKEDHARAKGAYEQVMKEIKDEFGCDDLKSAKKKVDEMEKEIEELDSELDSKMKEFRKEFDL